MTCFTQEAITQRLYVFFSKPWKQKEDIITLVMCWKKDLSIQNSMSSAKRKTLSISNYTSKPEKVCSGWQIMPTQAWWLEVGPWSPCKKMDVRQAPVIPACLQWDGRWVEDTLLEALRPASWSTRGRKALPQHHRRWEGTSQSVL